MDSNQNTTYRSVFDRGGNPPIKDDGYYLLHHSGVNPSGDPVSSTIVLFFVKRRHCVYVDMIDTIIDLDIDKVKPFHTLIHRDTDELPEEFSDFKIELYYTEGDKIKFESGNVLQRLRFEGIVHDDYIVVNVFANSMNYKTSQFEDQEVISNGRFNFIKI